MNERIQGLGACDGARGGVVVHRHPRGKAKVRSEEAKETMQDTGQREGEMPRVGLGGDGKRSICTAKFSCSVSLSRLELIPSTSVIRCPQNKSDEKKLLDRDCTSFGMLGADRRYQERFEPLLWYLPLF